MTYSLPRIYLVRHGETLWSLSGQHTGRTDVQLTKNGELNAVLLGNRLRNIDFDAIYSSPSSRAKKTCELAGFGSTMQIDNDLSEWNYGDYEGLTTLEIQQKRPGWNLFLDGCPRGESASNVFARANKIMSRLKNIQRGNVLLFSHGHFLRVLAACWLDLSIKAGRLFALSPTSLSILGYEHNSEESVILLWNDTCSGK